VNVREVNHQPVALVNTQTPFFIPEHATVPVSRVDQLELWIEATIPRRGPPVQFALLPEKTGSLRH
jgi:hypothetical protein